MAGTIIERGNAFVVVMDHGRDPQTGKRRRKWTTFGSRREAEMFRAQSASHPAFAAGVGPYGSTRLRVGDFLSSWLRDYARLNVKPRTHQAYEQFIRCHLAPRLGHLAIVRLTPQIIQGMYADLLDAKLSKTTVHHIGVLLREILDYAVRRGVVAQNPADKTDIPARGTPTLKQWTVEQACAFLNEARHSSKYPLFYELAMATGLRVGEIRMLTWADFDLSSGVLHVPEGKTPNARRAVLLPESLTQELRQRRGIGLVFHTKRGTSLNLSNIRFQDFWPTIRRANVPRVRLHDLRHFHASLLVASGVDLASVSGRLGHASKGFTLQTYGHQMVGGQERAAVVANQLLTDSRASRDHTGTLGGP